MPTLEVTTLIGCPQRCTFCPQPQLLAAYPRGAPRMLSLEDFRTVLAKVPPYVRIDFSGFAEPFANPECAAMLHHAIAIGRQVAVYTTLLGLRMAQVTGVVEMLAQNRPQVEVVCVHLPDANGNMTGFRDSDDYRYALGSFRAAAVAGRFRRFELMTMDAIGRPEPLLDAGRLTPWKGHDRAGVLDRAAVGQQAIQEAVRHASPVSCSFTPFYDQNVLLPNGDVVLCCMDYKLSCVVGNLLQNTYDEVFSSARFAELRAANTAPSGDSICHACTRATTYSVSAGNRQMWVANPPKGE